MMTYDPYRRGWSPETQEARRVVAEMRQLAERALRERELALQQRDEALAARKAALQQRDAALRERDLAVQQKISPSQSRDLELLQNQVEALQDELETLRQEREATPAPGSDPRVQQLAADLANVRRLRDEHIARARTEEKVAGLRALANVYDDLLFSLQSNPDRESPWYQGHQAILANVRQALRAAGATEVGQAGDRFDPRLHEAIGLAEGPPGTVVAVDRPGWKLEDGTLIRPAQVRAAA